MKMLRGLSWMLLSAFLITTACSTTRVYVHKSPPKKIEEVKPKKTYKTAVWIPGHWQWNKRKHKYVWIKGYWRKVKSGKTWKAGYWEKTPHGWIWIKGCWN